MKKIIMFMPVMKGGGAERVAANLMNEFHRLGCETEFVITSGTENDTIKGDLGEETRLTFLKKKKTGLMSVLLSVISSVLCKFFEKTGRSAPASLAYLSFVSQYKNEISQIKKILKDNPHAVAIAFLQPTIPMLMLAARGLPNKVIFSERGDPIRLMKHRYGKNFIEKYYERTDAAVFQTFDAKSAYPENITSKGAVISNPIKSELPDAYHGERNSNITTFCRISKQKNLPLLLESFNMLHREHPGFTLRIIGDVLNEEGVAVKEQLEAYIKANGLENCVRFEPFNANVHEAVINDAMYVNSSDYEGISNAMLEAMAIGMPCVCTDCPIGGARATIKDGENGLLTPVGDTQAFYKAMKRVIEENGLSEKLSLCGEKLREELSLEKTAKKWMELF